MRSLQISKKFRPRLRVQVIARAAEVLRALEGNEQGLSLGQLSRQLNLPKSTIQRIVDALDTENFVVAASPTARVRLGPALLRIAHSVRFRFAETVKPYLEELSKSTGETVDLAILDGAKAVFVENIEGSQRLRAVSDIGVAIPLHCTASGKAMLAALEPEVLSKLTRSLPLTAYTPQTIHSRTKLLAELEIVRQTGFAYDREEHTLGISAVGASFRGTEGELAAISILTPSIRFTEKEASLVAALQSCRKTLIKIFGVENSTGTSGAK